MNKLCTVGLLSLLLISLLTGCDLFRDPQDTDSVITGSVRYANSSTHEGIIVSLERSEGGRTMTAVRVLDLPEGRTERVLADQTTTREDGSYRFEGIPEGTYTLYASSKDSSEKAVYTSLTVSEGRAVTAPELQLTSTGTISGQVVLDETATGNAGFLVCISGTSFMAFTDDGGDFLITDVPAKTGYSIMIMKGSDIFPWETAVTVLAGEEKALGVKDVSTPDPSGSPLNWLGESSSVPEAPAVNDAYFNTTDGSSYIYDGSSWDLLAQAGEDGTILSGVSYLRNGADAGYVPEFRPGYVDSSVTVSGNIHGLEKRGYRFNGWNSEADGGGTVYEAGASLAISDSITFLYAQWEILEYSISYDFSYGSNSIDNPGSYTVDSATIVLADLEDTIFSGWYSDSDYNTAVTSIPAGSVGDLRLYGKTIIERKIIPSDLSGGDYFGRKVDISGDYMISGASQKDKKGAAYIYERQSDGSWQLAETLTAPDGFAYDSFGISVAIAGSYAVVGATGDDDEGSSSGSAYVYLRDAEGRWNFEQKLKASDAGATSFFGISISIDGELMVIGSHGTDAFTGSAYIFELDTDGDWQQQSKIMPSGDSANLQFGLSVDISGTHAVIGACFDFDHDNVQTGAAYIFGQNSDGSWSQKAKLTASDRAIYDWFGSSVSIDGLTAVVGASLDDPSGSSSGSAYIFERVDGSWAQTQKLTASDGAGSDEFGSSAALDGSYLLISSPKDDDNGSDSGSTYLFEKQSDGSWSEKEKIGASDGASNDNYGKSVALEGERACIGASGVEENRGEAYNLEF